MRERLQSMPPVIFLMGPTATGKTELAMQLAARFPVDVISVDAGQVYREMNIGTAKPSRAVLQRVPHKLIDILSPWERYSAGRFRNDALVEIKLSLGCGRVPLLVGGTSFYFWALEEGLSDLPPRSDEISQALLEEAEAHGWPHLHQKLMKLDAVAAQQVSPNDSQRILRLLEVCVSQGRPASEIKHSNTAEPLPYQLVKLAVARADRNLQNQVIKQRFLAMLDAGLMAEAQRLYCSTEFDPSLPSMRSVGYQQAWQYFRGELNYEQMVTEAIRETCSIAKRQLTWIRNQAGVIWNVYGDHSSASRMAQLFNSILQNDSNINL